MNGTIGKAVAEFISLYLQIIVFFYAIALGILMIIGGRLIYGAFGSAFALYGAHTAMAASSIVGLLPIYGNKLHYLIAMKYILPWATLHGVEPSWFFSLSGVLSGAFGAMCPAAFILRIAEARWDGAPVVLLVIGAFIFFVGTLYSVSLFFGI